MEDTNSFIWDDFSVEKTRNIMLGEDGEIKPWVVNKLTNFLSTCNTSTESSGGNEKFEGNWRSFIFGEDGMIKPWIFPKLLSFISTLNEDDDDGKHSCAEMEMDMAQKNTSHSETDDDDGRQARSEMEMDRAQKTPSHSEMEMEGKVSTPSLPGKHTEDNQNQKHDDDDGGNNEKQIVELDKVHTVSPNSVVEVYSGHKEPGEEDDTRKVKLFELIQLAAKKGNYIFNDANFLERWSLMERELFASKDNNMKKQTMKEVTHISPTGNELNRNNGGNGKNFQGEGSSKEEGFVHGPTDDYMAVLNQRTNFMGKTASQGPPNKDPCTTDNRETNAQRTKVFPKGLSDKEVHVPQNVEKVAQLFQHLLQGTSTLQHVVVQSGGNSNLQHKDKALEIEHMNLLKKFKPISDFLQQSTEEQKGDNSLFVHYSDEDVKKSCSPYNDKERGSFADVLKHGINGRGFPMPTYHTDGKDFHTFSASQALQQGKIFSIPYLASDDSSFFKVEHDVLEKRLNLCKFSIVGRLSLGKGERPWTQKTLKEKLQGIWNINSTWKLISLGRGYFHILLNSQDEWNKVWSRGPIHLKPGVMRLQRWKLDFDPWTEKTSTAQVWLRIYHLPWALWDPSVIAGVARKVGVPLRFDNVTTDGEFGHYARILVDIDISKPLKKSVHIECGQFRFEVKLVPENLPAFCRGCSTIGHDTKDCRNIFKKKDSVVPSKRLGGDERAINSAFPLGTLDEFSTGNLASSSKNPTDVRKVHKEKYLQGTEWRRKKENDTGKATKENETDYGIVESITDFSAQTGSHFSYDAPAGYVEVSNKFAALERKDDFEDSTIVDSKNTQVVDGSGVPKRWSDILDEEDEKDDSEPLHPYRDNKPQEEKVQGRDISEIREGLQEMSREYAHLLHPSTSNKKKKKLKLGIKQSKEPSGSTFC